LAGAGALPRAAFAGPLIQAPETLKIVTALPMTGSSYGQTSTIVNSIHMALDEVSNKVGPFLVEYEAWDDATAAAGKWDAAKAAELANRAAADPDIMVYIGHFNSGAAKIAIPVLNQVGLVMISPANTYPGLTKPGKGDPGEPDVYYPTGVRNYTRVIPADDLQGAVGAAHAQTLGAASVYILDDTELYGKGIADVFANTVPKLGIKILGRDGINGRAADYRAIATKIRAARPDVIYFGGITQNNAGKLVKDIRDAGITVPFIGPDGIQEKAFLDDAGTDAEGVYSTFGGVPVTAYQGIQKEWADRYRAAYSGADPETYAVYGYEAARVALAAIERAGVKDREAIRQAVFGTQNFTGVLGTWSFDQNGDTSVTTMTVSQAKRGPSGQLEWDLVQTLTAPA
jgi:branched-chain amino acid transport system substrate-binding protein